MNDAVSQFEKYPTGKIDTGEFCATCGRYNNRYVTVVVIALVDDKILIVHRDHEPERGKWSLPGGYIEWDETVAEAAKRELTEETGLHSPELQLVGIRSDESAADGRQNVEFYFFTDKVLGTITPQEGEIKAVKWVEKSALPKLAFSHHFFARQVIEALPLATPELVFVR